MARCFDGCLLLLDPLLKNIFASYKILKIFVS